MFKINLPTFIALLKYFHHSMINYIDLKLNINVIHVLSSLRLAGPGKNLFNQ